MENPIKSTFFEYVENIAELNKKRKQNVKLPILMCKTRVPQYLQITDLSVIGTKIKAKTFLFCHHLNQV